MKLKFSIIATSALACVAPNFALADIISQTANLSGEMSGLNIKATTVNIVGDFNLKGGYIEGKTLNFGSSSKPLAAFAFADNIIGFENMNFYIDPAIPDSQEILLQLSDKVDISGANVTAYLKDAKNLDKDSEISLISTTKGGLVANNITTSANANIAGLVNVKGKIVLGTSLDLVFKEEKAQTGSDTGANTGANTGAGGNSSNSSANGENSSNNSNSNNAPIGTVSPSGGAKILLETKLAQSVALNEGANLLTQNFHQISSKSNETNTFVFLGGSDKKYKTGSHIDIKGFNAVAGVAGDSGVKNGDLTTGAFIEYGIGEYESVLDDGTKGKGDTQYAGLGVLAKYQSISNFYLEASARVGRIKTEYETTAAYEGFKLSSTYYGAHIGVGQIFAIGESNDLDIYARGIYSKTSSNDEVIAGMNTHFSGVSSMRMQIGAKDSFKIAQNSKLYAGAAYQYEFDGESNGEIVLTGFGATSIASPKLKGSSGIGEIGYVYERDTLKFEIGAKGYVGREEGYSGNLGLTLKF